MPKTLLLADDSVTIQKVVGITFANEDIDLVTVDNGTDALTKARQIFPDLVLADIGMPGMDGYELCAAIRRLPELSHVPVLLLTGTFESYDEVRARTAGASGHISKPFEAQALVDRVWALLAEAETAQGATRVADPLERIPAAPAVPAPVAAPDPLADLPELPNSSFGASRAAPPFAPGPRLPEAKASDLFDLAATRPPLSPPLEEDDAFLPSPTGRTSPWHEADPLDASPHDPSGGETAFLDPLHDLTPPLTRPESAAGASLLPRAEAPDFLDLGSPIDPQGDTSPTYADGSSIASGPGEPLDADVESGESLALIVPPAGHASPLVEAQELPEIDPLDLEPLEPVDPRDATLRATAPALHAPEPVPVPAAEPDPRPTGTGTALDRDALHGALEKLAWEAFGSLSQELVEQFTRRLEAILWEVVPVVAERMVREEIARLKSEP